VFVGIPAHFALSAFVRMLYCLGQESALRRPPACMPPYLALLLCSGVVFFLLRLDRKQSPHASVALWVPTLWLLSVSSKPLGAWLGAQGTVEGGSQWDQVLLGCLLVLGVVILATRQHDWSNIIREHGWVLLIVGYMLFSTVWSGILVISFKRWIRELLALIMMFLILSDVAPKAAVATLIRRSAYILIPFSMMLIKYFPFYGVAYGHWDGKQMWVGMAMHKNSLGRLCMVSAFFITWALIRRINVPKIQRIKYHTAAELGVLALSLYMLKGAPNAYSTTSIVALFVGVGLLAALFWMRKKAIQPSPWVLGAAAAMVIAYGTLTPLLGGATLGHMAGAMGRDDTLTGRTDIWAAVMPTVLSNPLIGVGFGGYWTSATIDAVGENECHNGFLEVLLELGLIGLVLISAYVISCSRKATALLQQDFDWGCLWTCYIFMSLVHNVGESSVSTFCSQLTAIVLLLSGALGSAAVVGWKGSVPLQRGRCGRRVSCLMVK